MKPKSQVFFRPVILDKNCETVRMRIYLCLDPLPHRAMLAVITELYYTLERVLNPFLLDHSVREQADVI